MTTLPYDFGFSGPVSGRGVTLENLLTMLRAEAKLSVNPAHNVQVRDQQVIMLQRIQETLWDDYTWPHLRVYRYLTPAINQRFYDITGCKKLDQGSNTLVAAGDMTIDRVEKLWIRDGSMWRPMDTGIDERQFNAWNSDTAEVSWPPRRWQVAEDNQIEIWPIPGLAGDETNQLNIIRVHGVRNLAPLTKATDTADLDARLMTLMAAAELLDGEDGKKKSILAQRRMFKVRGNNTKRRQFRMFGEQRPTSLLRGPPTVYYRTTS